MYIGEFAKRSQVSIKALRLYEALGLLGPVARRGKYRVYSEQTLQQVQMIRRAQALGFRLAELQAMLDARSGVPDWQGVLQQLERRTDAVTAEIRRLEALRADLHQIRAELTNCLATPGWISSGEASACA